MKFTHLLFWVQENKISEKFYKKLGFEVVEMTDTISTVRLGDFEVSLVNMREDAEFARDTFSGDKGRGMYVYIQVDDVDACYADLLAKGFPNPHTAPKLALGHPRIRPKGSRRLQASFLQRS